MGIAILRGFVTRCLRIADNRAGEDEIVSYSILLLLLLLQQLLFNECNTDALNARLRELLISPVLVCNGMRAQCLFYNNGVSTFGVRAEMETYASISLTLSLPCVAPTTG